MNQEVDTESSEGVWPNPIRQFFWDFLPKSIAPQNSGIRLPEYEAAEWMTDVLYRRDEVLDLARREQAEAESRAKHAEDKAHRLMQTSLALLTLALANAGFQLSYIRDQPTGWLEYLWVLPTGLAVCFLVIAGIEGLEIERVGIYWPLAVADFKDVEDFRRELVEGELRGSFVADWTAGNKVDALLQARAWFSRGLIFLLAAALISLGMVANQGPTEPARQLDSPKASPGTSWKP